MSRNGGYFGYDFRSMHFPVIFQFFGLSVHAHLLMEILGYTIGFQTFLYMRRKNPADRIDPEHLLWLIAGCITGAMVGSKVLAWAESFPDYWLHRHEAIYWLGGKTIAGGLIGGWIGVEIVKKILKLPQRTGDGYVIPLCIGIAIGRIGCFLSGLDDHTHGIETRLPWGVDFGDQIRRHPTQLYEVIFLILFAIAIGRFGKSDNRGARFRIFIASYMGIRFLVEFIKPSWKGYIGLSAIQIAAFVTMIVSMISLLRMKREYSNESTATTTSKSAA